MKRIPFLCLALLLGALALPSQAQRPPAERRVALVIGNDAYQHIPKLDNAANDAQAMAKELAEVGFEVLRHQNLDRRAMNVAIRDFEKRISGGGVGVFFYAGHGIQTKAGANLLLPIDVPLPSDEKLLINEAIVLGDVLDDLRNAKAKFTLAIIDACRDNPLAKVGVRNVGGTRGLAPVSAEGTMVIFSAGAGQQALDKLGPKDTAKNGLFTREFINAMKEPNVPVDRMVKSVQRRVQEMAQSVGHVQRPSIYNESTDDFIFRVIVETAAASAVATARRQSGPDPDAEYWAIIRDSQKREDFEAYLKDYPKGRYAKPAEAKLRQLTPSPVPQAAPSATIPPAVAQTAAPAPSATPTEPRGLDRVLNESVRVLPAGELRFETTLYRPAGPGPFPIFLYLHSQAGARPGDTHPRPTPKLLGLHAVARGYAVVVPSMPYFGQTTGKFETGTPCEQSRFFDSMARALRGLIEQGLSQPDLDNKRIVLVGGGTAAELGARALPGVIGIINMGGTFAAPSCSTYRATNTERAKAVASQVAVPQLWLYRSAEPSVDVVAVAEHFKNARHNVQLVQTDRTSIALQSLNSDGPWQATERYLQRLGLPSKPNFAFLDRTESALLRDRGNAPPHTWSAAANTFFAEYQKAAKPKAFALNPSDAAAVAYYFGTPYAATAAIARCERHAGLVCKIEAQE